MRIWNISMLRDEYDKISESKVLAEPNEKYSAMSIGDIVNFTAVDRYDELDIPGIAYRVSFVMHYQEDNPENTIRLMLESEGLENLVPDSTLEQGIDHYLKKDYERISNNGIYSIGLGERLVNSEDIYNLAPEAHQAAMEMFESDGLAVVEWFSRKIKLLNNMTPYDVCKQGREKEVLGILYGLEHGSFL